MKYRSLREAVEDLDRHGHLVRVTEKVDPYLEAAAIHRRVFDAGGPAVYFEHVKGCRFPMVSNLFGTMERTRFLFRSTLEKVQRLVELKVDPSNAAKNPFRYVGAIPTAWAMRPKRVLRGPILDATCSLRDLPQLVCWPKDGGPFVTLPQVYSEDVTKPGWMNSNLGMYRVQFGGNDYADDECGLHYQIHRSIGVHHANAIATSKPFPVTVFVGGPPSLAVAAVMPLPEGLSELTFAGALGGRRVRMVPSTHLPVVADCDFAIEGIVDGEKPEGPFGDHLGYYSLTHNFPCLKVTRVRHRKDAIWPFTVVGRPPQEDTAFGDLIHELTGPAIPTVLPGVHAVNAVDAAGVHPLLLAVGSERYVPYASERTPQELLTIANAILGQGQLSLAKYLVIVAKEDSPPDIHDIGAFFSFVLERVDWTRDLHFQTRTTIDTLDYSGSGFNEGSKVVIAAAGRSRRLLTRTLPEFPRLPEGFTDAAVCAPGILAVTAPAYASAPSPRFARPSQGEGEDRSRDGVVRRFCEAIEPGHPLREFPLILLVDDARFAAASLNNWLWVTFTRSNPAADIHGVDSFVEDKHWGCRGPLVIDARIKPHHAPALESDPEVERRVDRLGERGGSLYGII